MTLPDHGVPLPSDRPCEPSWTNWHLRGFLAIGGRYMEPTRSLWIGSVLFTNSILSIKIFRIEGSLFKKSESNRTIKVLINCFNGVLVPMWLAVHTWRQRSLILRVLKDTDSAQKAIQGTMTRKLLDWAKTTTSYLDVVICPPGKSMKSNSNKKIQFDFVSGQTWIGWWSDALTKENSSKDRDSPHEGLVGGPIGEVVATGRNV